MKRTLWCMKNEAELRSMKCGFATWRRLVVLRFMRTKVSASYEPSECFISAWADASLKKLLFWPLNTEKKHLQSQVLFSTKFALRASEIASLWNICSANVKYSLRECGQISFHIATDGSNISQCAIAHYFTFGGRRIFHLKKLWIYGIMRKTTHRR